MHRPDVIVLNTGYARVTGFEGSIIMGRKIARARKLAPHVVVIGVHMEAPNHATQTRQELVDHIAEKDLDATRTRVLADGETYVF